MFPISWMLYNRAKKVENEVNQYQENAQAAEEEEEIVQKDEHADE